MNTALLGALELKRGSGLPLHKQLEECLRDRILDGKVDPGTRLPSTRALSKELGLSRNTVISAYDQLVSEGYLESRTGDGTRVSVIHQTHFEGSALAQTDPAGSKFTSRELSALGNNLASTPRQASGSRSPAFSTGLPAIDVFPHTIWARTVGKVIRNSPIETLGYTEPGGYAPLRQAIANHLRTTRGVHCESRQVLVMTGAQAALDFICRMLLDRGDQAWIEDPGYLGARGALKACGAELLPIEIDREGLDIYRATTNKAPKLIYVTPSYQFPLGVTMSLPRRLSLLEFAGKQDAWILEDDYDSDYRYEGRPLSALQGLDQSGRVIYAGTFSKTMFPALRIAYLVVPHSLVAPFRNAIQHTGQEAPMLIQAALAEFMMQGHYRAHTRKMQKLYLERQHCFVDLVKAHLDKVLDIEPRSAGMQLTAFYKDGKDRPQIAEIGRKAGISLRNLSAYYLNECKCPGLFLGYAAVNEAEMLGGIQTLKRVMERCPTSTVPV